MIDQDPNKKIKPSLVLKSDLHLHLYGSITADSLWELGKDRHRQLTDRMNWYVSEYEKAFHIRPDYQSWWNSENNFNEFCKTMQILEPMTFEQFQAKFNLIIALNPPSHSNLALAKSVFQMNAEVDGIREYRTFIPHFLNAQERELYIESLLRLAETYDSEESRILLAFSIDRNLETSLKMYEWLLYFLKKNKWAEPFVTGIDFCASEYGHSPESKRQFFETFFRDKTDKIHSFDLMYHVGEMWSQMSIWTSIRWIENAVSMGVSRIGHGLSAGIQTGALLGTIMIEDLRDFKEHCAWLKRNEHELNQYGYGKNMVDEYITNAVIQFDRVTWTMTESLCLNVYAFQNAILKMLRKLNPVFEVCLTSNLRLGGLKHVQDHAIHRFLGAGLQTIFATDDPGIFDITL
ncbi:MAG: hypothetical protein NT027_12005, partial [Proteobacteria bacterium]|nr:hypothetical protein [Pseudomonadota bacterium]